jgi:hypothetical protein
MTTRRKERIARNENAFRALNESLGASVHSSRPASDLAGFVCECGDPDCDTIVRVEVSTYESIRSDSQLFLIVPGHELPDAEDVVDAGQGYAVVRKHADVAAIVERENPRTP